MRQARFVDRFGNTSLRDVPDREWGVERILASRIDGMRRVDTVFKAQLWRSGTDKSTDVFIYVEDGAPDGAVKVAGETALARREGVR